MFLPLMLATGLLSATESPANPPTPTERVAYEAARSQAGRDASAQVQLALWCEAHGLPAERLKHLALAALCDPQNAAARGLMGVVRYQNGWSSPEKVARQVEADANLKARLALYHERRDKAPPTADAQVRLAQWCEENGLLDESRAHHAIVLRIEPGREISRRKLGYKKEGKRWVTEGQLADEKEEVRRQKEADRKWKALLTEWRGWLGNRDESREEASQRLSLVTDPRAVPAVMTVFSQGNEANRNRAVRLLGQIDVASSSRALANFALFDPATDIRRAATEILSRRDPREFAGLLVAMMRDLISYEVRPVSGPGSPGALYVQGQQFHVERRYSPPPIPENLLWLLDWAEIDNYGRPVIRLRSQSIEESTSRVLETNTLSFPDFMRLKSSDPALQAAVEKGQIKGRKILSGQESIGPNNFRIRQRNPSQYGNSYLYGNISRSETTTTPMQTTLNFPIGEMIAEYQKTAQIAQAQLESDKAQIDQYNLDSKQTNERVSQILRDISGESHDSNPKQWQTWFIGVVGYRPIDAPTSYKPTFSEDVPLAYYPSAVPYAITQQKSGPSVVTENFTASIGSKIASCFGAGTLVRTLDGTQAIETLKVGDRVLTQSVKDGSLAYHPITKVHHNPPSPTFLVKVGGDTIVSSPFHRFWVAGQGWKMARDLDGNETLRLLEGTKRVESVEPGPVQPVFNLDVAGDHDFFAGSAAALVHDNTLPDTRLVPFDAPPTLAELSARKP